MTTKQLYKLRIVILRHPLCSAVSRKQQSADLSSNLPSTFPRPHIHSQGFWHLGFASICRKSHSNSLCSTEDVQEDPGWWERVQVLSVLTIFTLMWIWYQLVFLLLFLFSGILVNIMHIWNCCHLWAFSEIQAHLSYWLEYNSLIDVDFLNLALCSHFGL